MILDKFRKMERRVCFCQIVIQMLVRLGRIYKEWEGFWSRRRICFRLCWMLIRFRRICIRAGWKVTKVLWFLQNLMNCRCSILAIKAKDNSSLIIQNNKTKTKIKTKNKNKDQFLIALLKNNKNKAKS